MSSRELGGPVIDFIIQSNLIHAPEEGLIVWSANAHEQINEFLDDRIVAQDMVMDLLNDKEKR